MKLITTKQQKSYQNSKTWYICDEKFEDEHAKDKNYCIDGEHCHYIGNIDVQHIAYAI